MAHVRNIPKHKPRQPPFLAMIIPLTWYCLIVVSYLFREPRETDTIVALKYLIICPYLSRKAIPRNEASLRSREN